MLITQILYTKLTLPFRMLSMDLKNAVKKLARPLYVACRNLYGKIDLKSLLGPLEKPLLRKTVLNRQNNKSKKIKLLVCITWMKVGGVERVILNTLEGLDKNKFEIYIITSLPNENKWEPKFKKHAKQIFHLPKVASKKNHSWFIAELAKRKECDSMLITNNIPAYEALPNIKPQNPKITILDLLHTHGRPQEKDAFLPLSSRYDQYIDKHVVISNYLKNYFLRKYKVSSEKVEVIYNSIDAETLNHTPSKAKWRLRLDPAKQKFIVCFVGRLADDKNPLRVIEIANILVNERKFKNLLFVIAGEGPLKKKLIEVVDRYNLTKNVILLGHVEDVLELMALSDLVIITSDMEGVPLTALEAMSVGTPVIALAVGGLPEIINHKKDGYLVRMAGNMAINFANQIKYVIDHPEGNNKVKAMARKKVLYKFTSTNKRYEELLTKDK